MGKQVRRCCVKYCVGSAPSEVRKTEMCERSVGREEEGKVGPKSDYGEATASAFASLRSHRRQGAGSEAPQVELGGQNSTAPITEVTSIGGNVSVMSCKRGT
jgi:hypothetical protein